MKVFRRRLKDRILLFSCAMVIFIGLSVLGNYIAYRIMFSNFDGRFDAHIEAFERNLLENQLRIEKMKKENESIKLAADREINNKNIRVLEGTNVGLQYEIDKFK